MASPVVDTWAPTGATEDPDAIIQLKVSDADGDLDSTSIELELSDPNIALHTVITGGVFNIAGGYNGTIVGDGFALTITVTTAPYWIKGTWQADFDIEDLALNLTNKNWTWTVVANDPVLSNQNPIGVKTGEMNQISCVITDDWGLDKTTLDFSIIPPVGDAMNAIVGGVFQTGYSGVIIENDLDADTYIESIEVILNTWPELDSGKLYTFSVDIDTVVGTSL